jgi:hypothetical protein
MESANVSCDPTLAEVLQKRGLMAILNKPFQLQVFFEIVRQLIANKEF